MTPMNKCQICEKPTQGTPLCVACESEVLKKQKGRSMVLSVAMGLIMIGAVYFVWNEYSGNVTGSLENFLATGTAILRSPFILAPVLLILIVVAFYWGVKLTK
jgi:hypothetical protein